MATQFGGYMGKVLDIDLTRQVYGEYSLTDRERELFIGGKGLAAKILYDQLPEQVNPFSPRNLLVIMTSPLTGTGAPCSSRFNISAKSPLTCGIASSNCGGNFGIHLKKAGYDGIVIRGRAKHPTWLLIEDEAVQFMDATTLWGLDTAQAQEAMPGKGGRLVIGPAGEHLVRYACIISGERAAGRCGMGAVMGAKNLKGILARGTHKITTHAPQQFKQTIQQWIASLKAHPITGKRLPQLGTANLVRPANRMHAMPYRNFQQGHWEEAVRVSGEAMAEELLVKNIGCTSCPIRCGRQVRLADGRLVKGPEYETLGMFGPNIANTDLAQICEWNYQMDLLGLDTISTGSVIAFAMELAEKKLIKQTLGFGQTSGISKLITDIAYRRDFGNELAEGSMRLAAKYGGSPFAMHSKGLEFAAYDPRAAVGHGLGYATSNRGGCHLNGGYLIFFEGLGPITVDPLSPYAKPALCVLQQNLLEAISIAGSCIFTSYAVIPGFVEQLIPQAGLIPRLISTSVKLSRFMIDLQEHLEEWMLPLNLPVIPHSQALRQVTGFPFTLGKFLAAGDRTFNLERLINLREGLGACTDQLPDRLTRLADHDKQHTQVPLNKMRATYYRIRRWDSLGLPSDTLLNKLGLSFALPQIHKLRKLRPTQWQARYNEMLEKDRRDSQRYIREAKRQHT